MNLKQFLLGVMKAIFPAFLLHQENPVYDINESVRKNNIRTNNKE